MNDNDDDLNDIHLFKFQSILSDVSYTNKTKAKKKREKLVEYVKNLY